MEQTHVLGFDVETHLTEDSDLPCQCGDVHATGHAPLVCATFAGGPESYCLAEAVKEKLGEHCLIRADDRGEWALLMTGPAQRICAFWLISSARVSAAHFAGFDLYCLAEGRQDFLEAYADMLEGDDPKIACTKVRQQTIDIGRGTEAGAYGLDALVKRHFGVDISAGKKDDGAWRLRYAELDGIPAMQWPEGAVDYALGDAVWARACYISQAKNPIRTAGIDVVRSDGRVMMEGVNLRAHVAMEWMRERGVQVDPEAVDAWVARLTKEVATLKEHARGLGIITINRCNHPGCEGTGFVGSYPTHRLCPECLARPHDACLAAGLYKRKAPNDLDVIKKSKKQALIEWCYEGHQVPHTAPSKTFPKTAENPQGGQVSTTADDFNNAPRTTPLIKAYVETLFAEKQMSTYVPPTQAAVASSDRTVRAWHNPIVSSNRTSCSKPNLQNPPQKGGYRECHVAREGHVLTSCDYSSLELRTHAQYCIDKFGFSTMGEVLNEPDGDVYLDFAAKTLGIPYAEAMERKKAGDKDIKAARTQHKPAILGYPGGLGAKGFVGYARGFGLELSMEESQDMKNRWVEAFPEMSRHLALISEYSNLAGGERFAIADERNGWAKAKASYCSAANMTFQCPGGVIIKDALWAVWRKCYVDAGNALYQKAHPVIVIHDEIIAEGEKETAHLWAQELADTMVEVAERRTPDVRHYVDPALFYRWSKSADTARDETGRLIPWEDRAVA